MSNPLQTEPIAIIGVGCRFPGDSFSPSKLWDLLKEGRSAQSDLPKNRFDVDAWYHPDAQRPGSIPNRGGYFLSHDDSHLHFDPAFFGINPLEAATMDPQQRKLLEVVYESFESAGATLGNVSGSKTSCYVGCFTRDVANMNAREAEYAAPYQMTGSDMTILSNRVNYVFNLKGPSMTVDTACSSSLYALHMACQSLLSGDSDAAVVGGTNIILGVEQQIATARLGVLSPTSACHTFDAAADGFGRGEGICAIYLKKLSAAVAANDPIRGVIRATAINSNGKSQGINHPSAKDQTAVIEAAYAKAGLDFSQTAYFECHGTGTPVGDPIEVAAIANILTDGQTVERPLLLGSIKTNIGHTEGASGLASLVKVILSIENDLIPATVGITKLNTGIDFKDGRLKVVQKSCAWPKGIPKRASINSFGYGGANAHCILESPDVLLGHHQNLDYQVDRNAIRSDIDATGLPATYTNGGELERKTSCMAASQTTGDVAKKYLLIFSAHDRKTLDSNISALAEHITNENASDLAYTLAYRKTKFRSMAFTTVTNGDISSQICPERVSHSLAASPRIPVIAFVFTGQGAQWPEMGALLMRQFPVVRQTIDELQVALDALPSPPDWRIAEELVRPAAESRVQEAALSQPLCTAIQIALTVLLRSWGLQAKAVVGHSSGEVAAAFAAGLLEAKEAIAVAYYRGISVSVRHTPGAMMAVGLGASDVHPYVHDQEDIVIACQNSPQSVTLSGGDEAINQVQSALIKDGVFARKLNTSNNAYHSHLVKEAGQYYEDCFRDSLPNLVRATRSSEIPMYSCISGEALSTQKDVGIGYWRKNLENPVLFTQALSSLVAAHPDINHVVEIGPHSALAGPIKQIRSALGLGSDDLTYLSSMVRGNDSVENTLKLAGSLHVAGYPIDLNVVNADGNDRPSFLSDLPPYQWTYDGATLWIENKLSHRLRFRQHPRHDILGSLQLGSSTLNPQWRNRLALKNVPWISDHAVGDDIIFPAAGYAAMAIEAMTQCSEIRGVIPTGFTMENVVIQSPLIIPPEGEVETLFNLRVDGDFVSSNRRRWCTFTVMSVTLNDKVSEHASGSIAIELSDDVPSISQIEMEGHRGAENKASNDARWYKALADIGLRYGPSFRPLTDIHTTPEEDNAMSMIDLDSTRGSMVQESRYMIHPAALDGCLQLAVIAAHKGNVREIVKAYLPTILQNLTVWRTERSLPSPKEGIVKSHGIRRGMRSAHGTSGLYSTNGEQLADMSVSLYSLEGGFGKQSVEAIRQPYTRLVWQPDIDRLYGEKIRKMFPSGANDPEWITLSNLLDKLGDLLVLETYDDLPIEEDLRDRPAHIQKFVRFLSETGKRLTEQFAISDLTTDQRRQRIKELVETCGSRVPEAELIAHMSTQMSKILRGEIGALDVMLQDGRLTKMYEQGFSHLAAYPQLKNVVSLIAHKEPRIRILEVGGGTGGATKPMLEALSAESSMPRFIHYTFTDITTAFLGAAQEKFQSLQNMDFRTLDIEKDPLSQGFEAESYDIILASNVIHATSDITQTLKHCRSLLKNDGRIVIIETTRDRVPISYMLGPLPGFWQGEQDGRLNSPFLSKAAWNDRLLDSGFSGSDILLDDYEGEVSSNSIIVSNAKGDVVTNGVASEKLWLIYREEELPLLQEIQCQAQREGITTESIQLGDLHENLPRGGRVVMLAELESALLVKMNPGEMDAVKALFKTASSAVWVTCGGLLEGKRPEHSLIFGIAKSIMTEQPSIQISSIDVDPAETDHVRTAELIVSHEMNLRHDQERVLDTELIEHDGTVYISRYIVDPVENADFARQLKPAPEPESLRERLELAFEHVGRTDSFYFQQKPTRSCVLASHDVSLVPSSYNLGRKEGAALQGSEDAEHFSSVCVALVDGVGPEVSKYKAGDKVICFKPGRFESSFIASEAYCELLSPDDDQDAILSSLLPYCTAYHALTTIGKITATKSLLVHNVCDQHHIAAVNISRMAGCETIVTFESTQRQQDFLARYPVLEGCKLLVADTDLVKTLSVSGPKNGIDVVLATERADLSELAKSVARDGSLIHVDGSQVPQTRPLDLSVLSRGASFTSFSISDTVLYDTEMMQKVVRRILMLLRDSIIEPIPAKARFSIADLPLAVSSATERDSTSSVIVTYASGMTVPIHSSYEQVVFSSTASYLLVGCLGGLGRSLVSWMVAQGACHFIFLSRSGSDKSEAAKLVRELEETAARKGGMSVTVVRGDVSNRGDVDRAIAMAKTPIRGVMQQAMYLKNDLFDEMPLQTWQGVLDPKVQGSINLHEALIDEPLDFFVMTSSVLGAIGASTQSNYAAANAFLDHMARYRWSMGLQACSIALGMIVEVGHVEAHPEVEEALRRNGVYGIPEDEYLKMMEVACRHRNTDRISWDWDKGAVSHIVTGMEPGRVTRAGGKSLWLQDARVRNLVMAIAGMEEKPKAAARGAKDISASLINAAQGSGESGVKTFVQGCVLGRFSSLVLVPVEKLAESIDRPLEDFGIDSMITAELRSWAWKELKADIPFMALLEGGMLLQSLVDLVWEKMDHSVWQN